MNGKIKMYLGLALVLVISAMATVGLFAFSAAPTAEAKITSSLTGVADGEGPRGVTVRVAAVPATINVTGSVTAVTVIQTPTDPGAPAKYEVKFTTDHKLDNGTDTIIITFDNEILMPTPLDRFSISISADTVTNGGAAGEAISPQDVTVDLVGVPADQSEVTLLVPDMDSSDNSGGNGIGVGAKVTVVFRQAAGLTNATESGNDPVNVRTSQSQTNVKVDVFTPVIIEMSNDDGSRGASRTFLAKGIEGNESVTFWLDYDADGVRDSSERDLCTAIADGDDTAACTVTISNPPFFPGRFGPDGTCTIGGPIKDCNFVNVVDSEGRTAPTATQADINQVNFELEPTVQIQPGEVNTGDTVTISLFDYPAGAKVDEILIGKINVTPATISETIASNGEKSFSFVVPGIAPNTVPDNTGVESPKVGCTGVGVPLALDGVDNTVLAAQCSAAFGASFPTKQTQRIPDDDSTADTNPNAGERVRTGKLRVDVQVNEGTQDPTDDADQDFNLTIGGANVSLSHEEVIGNQDLTITGSGFTEGSGTCILQGGITLNNVVLKIDDKDDCDFGDGVEVTSGGTFTLTVIVSELSGAVPTALLTPGSQELKIIDNLGTEGTIQVTVPEREITVTPLEARPRDTITISGRRFIADNSDGDSVTVSVKYECGSKKRTATADPDASGNWTETLRIPDDCAIPSTNTITAEIEVDGVKSGVVETVTHDIPEAEVIIEPGSGVSGSKVTVTGIGYRTFETLEKITFGGKGTLGGRTVTTDGNGDFSVDDVIVPGLDPGLHSVIVEVGTGSDRTTAATSFEILGADIPIGAPTDVVEAVEPLGDNLVRVFNFDNFTKTWTFYDPRPEFADANTIDELVGGSVYWINVADGQTGILLNNKTRNLTCAGDDCWNLIVW